jgi:hypothetical protein
LSPEQRLVVRAAVKAALPDLSVQFRRATPFTPMRQELRECLAALRAELVADDVTAETADAVTHVLVARAERLRTQQRHCDTPGFCHELHDLEAEILAAVDVLHDHFTC